MKKVKRILSLIGVIFLLSLYILTIIGAIIASPHSMSLFLASVYCTIVIPIGIYVYMMIYKLFNNKKEK